jgi:hypothetical protein
MTESPATTSATSPATSPASHRARDGRGAHAYRGVPSQRQAAAALGPLQDLPGFWEGTGFSMIARPDFSGGNPDGFFLELNLLRETIEFTPIGSPVFNRGSIQADIALAGVTYLHRVTDAVTGEALHIEPGVWLTVPATTSPPSGPSVVRLATVPHGNAVTAVGFVQDVDLDGTPTIPPANTVPFPIGSPPPPPGTANPFPEYDLGTGSDYRTSPVPAGITQAAVDDPNVLLREAIAEQTLTHVTRLITSTAQVGGISSIPFIVGNADTIGLESVFAIETVQGPGGREHLQLQYSQTALLNFRGRSFPHVTVGTLIKAF